MPAPLILASASPRRRELLQRAGLPFEAVPAEVQEWDDASAQPGELVLHNAALKAQWVAERQPGRLILGADTAVALEGAVLGKPRDLGQARQMLASLSGRLHRVHTGLVLLCPQCRVDERWEVVSEVIFKELNQGQIEDYLSRVDVLDKAGAYAIQGLGSFLVKSVRGSYTNVVGLPMAETMTCLRRAGIVDGG